MKQVKNMVSKVFGSHQDGQKAAPASVAQTAKIQICNYADNYYGDRVCVHRTAEQ
ncbi:MULTISPECIES: hypothetical protein [Thalassolituus]|jgi:uncharacterized protein YkwD|uniref:hypothetical protein n=1 Tax=Thalassolituus TaxID=187492 RepID=UPI001E40B572|nr:MULTISPECIES: hypothetical protein [Thalassolituus]MCB2386088.1 hypothetical protein [Thalassolituus alkanivorans]MCB2423076.1 hypothetical protein [Thalassolituus alkanivorans]